MALLQAAYKTYEYLAPRAGVRAAEEREPLTPVGHMIMNAQLEISIDEDGKFRDVQTIPKENAKTIIPTTEKSASRTSDPKLAHPLCDQLAYLCAAYGDVKHPAYVEQLRAWATSADTHPKVQAVLRYIEGGTLLNDLAAAGIFTLNEKGLPAEGKVEATEFEKCLVRWRVFSTSDDSATGSWEDSSLFNAYRSFYEKLLRGERKDEICILSGEADVPAVSHPKGIVAINNGAKLISSNDASGFTYRGRFADATEVGAVGYVASQKAHWALRWLSANHGVIIGGRTFLWWNPAGNPLPTFDFMNFPKAQEETPTFINYRNQLRETLNGFRQKMKAEDEVVVAALDAATTGRLSVTYYSEVPANDFLDRLEKWYATFCWDSWRYKMHSPTLKRVVQCAFGTQRGEFIEADDKALREHVQQLLHCMVEAKPLPADVMRTLASRAGLPLAYSPGNREMVLSTACAAVRKYRNDQLNKEEWTLALDENNQDRSYLYGRLLAVAEQVERSTYDREEGREPNAIRMQAVFSQRPQYAWRIVEEALNPYYRRLKPGLRQHFRTLIQGITDKLNAQDKDLNKRLDDTYLLGYYHQRAALFTKKDNGENKKMEEDDNGTAEQ